MRKLFFLFFVLSIISCDQQTNSDTDLSQLQKENDSLRTALKEYEDRYVYDFVALRQVPAKGNSFKKGSNYKGEITFLPTNKDDYILFGTETKEVNNAKEIINPDTLKPLQGIYTFETKLLTDTTRIYFKPLINNGLALDHANSVYNELSFVDEIVVEKN